MGKYKAMNPSLAPSIPFTQLYECKSFYNKVIDYSMGEELYHRDGMSALVCDVNESASPPSILAVRVASYDEMMRVKPFNHLVEKGGLYYTGIGGISRRGISYTALKSNHFITIPFDDYFANNTYLYPLSEGKKGKVSRAPFMIYSKDLDILNSSNKYELFTSYVLPSSEHWDLIFEAIYRELLSLLERDDEVVRINIGMCFLLCPFYHVRIVLDYATRAVCKWSEGFYSYLLNSEYEELLRNCNSICNRANSKLREIFSLVYGSGPEEVVKFNEYHRKRIEKFLSMTFSTKYNLNLALLHQKGSLV